MSGATMSPAEREDAVRVLEREIGVLMRRLRRVLAERARSLDPELPVSSYMMLNQLWQNEPMRASRLAALLDLDKGAVSRQVQHLFDLGLLEGSPDPDDGRATLLNVTEEGSRRLAAISSRRLGLYQGRLADWSDEDLTTFAQGLRRYNGSLSEPLDPEAAADLTAARCAKAGQDVSA